MKCAFFIFSKRYKHCSVLGDESRDAAADERGDPSPVLRVPMVHQRDWDYTHPFVSLNPGFILRQS